jgi:ABC-type antimicrobial peptide transport system permease subunit
VLQGGLVVSEEHFRRRFPSQEGYRMLLVDAPAEQADAVSRELTRGLTDAGLSARPAWRRLAELNQVQNTYLSIFGILGGLGLAVGSIGLGIVVLRNVLERRSELALLRAVGLTRARIRRLVVLEHWGLLVLGLAVGTAAALIGVLPALLSPGTDVPYGVLAAVLAGVLVNGGLWAYVAAAAALRGELLPALRNE